MNIGVDMDEVLVELVEGFLLYHNHNYGTQFVKADIFSYSFQEVMGGTPEEMERKLLDFFTSTYFDHLALVEGAQEASYELAKNNQLYLVTARPTFLEQQTIQCIQDYFPNRFQSIELTNQWYGKGKQRQKAEVCKEKNIEIMIDDSLRNAQECALAGVEVLLTDFNYPWNQTAEKLPENIKRVHSWKEIVEEIEKYERATRRGC